MSERKYQLLLWAGKKKEDTMEKSTLSNTEFFEKS